MHVSSCYSLRNIHQLSFLHLAPFSVLKLIGQKNAVCRRGDYRVTVPEDVVVLLSISFL